MRSQFNLATARPWTRLALALTVSASLPAVTGQSTATPLVGPTQGFVFDAPSGSLRQVVGSLGSAALGPTLLGGLDFASVAPQGSNGVGCGSSRDSRQCFVISGLGSEQPGQSPVSDVGSTTGAAWSADGGTVALSSKSEGWVRVLHGLPDALDIQPQWSITSLGGTLTSVAVNANGRHVVLAITGDHAGVYELTESGNFVPVLHATNPVALAFAGNSNTLLAADATDDTISEVDLGSGLTQSWPIQAVQDPIGIQAGRDANGLSVVYVLGHSDQALFAYNAESHLLAGQIPLSFVPTELQPLGGGSYQLTSRVHSDDLLWSFSAGRGVYFVPVTPLGSPEQTENTQRRVRR
jgi:hypothetical protein